MSSEDKSVAMHRRVGARAALRLSLAYAAFGVVWIVATDELLGLLIHDPTSRRIAEILKGWFFVLASSVVLFLLTRRLIRRAESAAIQLGEVLQAKRHTEKLLTELLDASPDGIFAKDLQGRYLLFNREVARVTGRELELGQGCSDKMLFPTGEAGSLRTTDLQVVAEDRVITVEDTLTTVDGLRTFQTVKGPLHDVHGRVDGVFGIARDVTERRRIEAELQMWATTFWRAGFAIAISDAVADTFIAVNPAYAGQRGYEPEELVGRPLSMVYSPGQYERIQLKLAGDELAVHGQVEVEQLRKDGSVFPVLLDVTIMSSPDGRPWQRIVLALELTERREAEEALRRAHEQLGIFVSAAPAAMAMLDRDLRYLACSDRWLQRYGSTREEVVGRSLFAIHPVIPDAWREVYHRGLAGETLGAQQDVWVQADGSRRWLHWSVSPWRDAHGGVGGIVISTEDVSDLVLAREEIAALKAELALRGNGDAAGHAFEGHDAEMQG